MKKLNITKIIIWIILPCIILICLSFWLPKLIITEIEIKANDYSVDAYITNKLLFFSSKKFNEVINDIKQVKINLISYNDSKRYEIIFKNSNGEEHTIIPTQFASSYYLAKDINEAIQSKTNTTFKIENLDDTSLYSLFSYMIIVCYICILFIFIKYK
jgi:ATP-dependent Zn protease